VSHTENTAIEDTGKAFSKEKIILLFGEPTLESSA
jgi:hypothetical protein